MRKARKDYNLLVLYPELAGEWDIEKNGDLKPEHVLPKSEKKVWWICPSKHSYEARVMHRTRGHGCIICYRDFDKNNLPHMFPNLIKEWDSEKNTEKPASFTYGSSKKVWWKCLNNHSWEAPISSRTTMGSGCPFCRKSYSVFELRVFTEIKFIFNDAIWGYKLKGRECDIFIPSLNLGIEIDGSYWHRNKFESDLTKNEFFKRHNIIILRLREKPLKLIDACNDIEHSVKDDRLKTIKNLINRIEKTKNIDLNSVDFEKFRNDELFNKLFSETNLPRKSLLATFPEIAKMLHPVKNGHIRPQNLSAFSNRKMWWVCESGHEWETTVSTMTRKLGKTKGCPYCYGKKVCKENSLQFYYPAIAKEWNFHKNKGLTPSEVTKASSKKVWWICPRGHEYQAEIQSRTISGTGCLACYKENPRKVSKETRKKLSASHKGKRNNSKLTKECVLHLRKKLTEKPEGMNWREWKEGLAKDFQVSYGTITNIHYGYTWKDDL